MIFLVDPLAQLAEHLTFNQRVVRSSRTRDTILLIRRPSMMDKPLCIKGLSNRPRKIDFFRLVPKKQIVAFDFSVFFG